MPGIPRAFASGARVAGVDGTDVHLLTVESWGDHVAVRLVGAATERTRQLIAEHETAMNEWAARRGAGADKRPPPWPAEQLYAPFNLRLDDGTGTRFRLASRRVGGTGTEFLGEWIFEPGVATNAERLILTVTMDDGAGFTQTFDLA